MLTPFDTRVKSKNIDAIYLIASYILE
jgi:hypothetical protein